MREKAIRFEIEQPTAHYRNPKYNQTDYIPTLELPSKSTIIGMLTYIVGRRIQGNIDIGIVGEFKDKEVQFIRGEEIEHLSKYRNLVKGKDKNKYLLTQEYYDFYKENCKNLILRHEVLRDGKLTIFIKNDNEEELKVIYNAINNPKYYMALGRKEDYILPVNKKEFATFIEFEKTNKENIRDLIKEEIKLKNTYVKVDLKDEAYDDLLSKGNFISLTSTYKDLNAPKSKREYVKDNYIYIDKSGIYPKKIEVNVFNNGEKKEVFTWL